MNLALKILAFIALIAIVLLAASSLLKERQPQQAQPRYYTVRAIDIERYVLGSGVLLCSKRAEIASRLPGKINQLLVQEGDAVQTSQILCKIINDKAQKDLQAAKAQVAELAEKLEDLQKLPDPDAVSAAENDLWIAQQDHLKTDRDYQDKKKSYQQYGTPSKLELDQLAKELERKKRIMEAKERALQKAREPASEVELTSARTKLEQAKSNVAEQEEKLNSLTVTSPLKGTILKLYIDRDQLSLHPDRIYPEGTPLFVVGDLTSLAVYGTIFQSDREKVKQHHPALVRCGAKGWLPAKVDWLSLVPEEGKYAVRIDFDHPPSDTNEGLTVDFRIVVEKKNNVLAVPVEYVDAQQGRYFVNKVIGETVSRVPIDVGISNYSFYQVTRGLKQGDRLRWDPALNE